MIKIIWPVFDKSRHSKKMGELNSDLSIYCSDCKEDGVVTIKRIDSNTTYTFEFIFDPPELETLLLQKCGTPFIFDRSLE